MPTAWRIYEIVQLSGSRKKMYAFAGNDFNRNLALVLSNTILTALANGTSLQDTASRKFNVSSSVGSQVCNAIVVRRWNANKDLKYNGIKQIGTMLIVIS